MVAVLLLLLDLVKYVRVRARVCVVPRTFVYDLYMLLLLLLLLLLLNRRGRATKTSICTRHQAAAAAAGSKALRRWSCHALLLRWVIRGQTDDVDWMRRLDVAQKCYNFTAADG